MPGRGGRGGRALQLCIVLRCSHCWHTPWCPAVRIPLSCWAPLPIGRTGFQLFHVAPWGSPPHHCSWRNLMFTVLSKACRLDINLDVVGLSGLDFFLTYFTQTLLPSHITLWTATASWAVLLLQMLGSCTLTTHSCFLLPSIPRSCILHNPDRPQHLLPFTVLPAPPDPSPASLQPCSNSWCSPRHSLLRKLFLGIQGLLGSGCKLGKHWRTF